jgi:hypothetical protein
MSFAEHWLAIVARLRNLQSAGELYARFQSYQKEDSYGAVRYLRKQCGSAVDSLLEFRQAFAGTLPPAAVPSLDHFLETSLAKAAQEGSSDTHELAVRGALVALAAVEAEVSFILSGRQEQIRTRSERAFMLLQRMITVDDDVRAKSSAALERGEVACERLGSVHLLSQGIFAFKVDAVGARTDLVFPEPPDDALLARADVGMVLTEWKVATAANAATQFRVAQSEAERYRVGALAGTELTGYRYLVAVSLRELPSSVIADVSVGGVIYRHINIVVAPATPSRAARGARKGSS